MAPNQCVWLVYYRPKDVYSCLGEEIFSAVRWVSVYFDSILRQSARSESFAILQLPSSSPPLLLTPLHFSRKEGNCT